jgi:uncharacterized protein (TIGR03437 family)
MPRKGRVCLSLCFAATLAGASPQDAPTLLAANVVNAADYRGGGVAPNEVVVLFAANAGPPEMVSWSIDAEHTGPYSLDSLGDTRVYFDNIAAPMVYAIRGKICAIVPNAVAGKTTTEVAVEYQGRRSPAVTLPVVDSAPAIFTLGATGAGQAAMLNETGCCNSIRNPVIQGTMAALYATGDGTLLAGMKPPSQPTAPPLPIKVTVGGVPAQVAWSGNTGVLQVNFRVPPNAPVGDAVPMVLTVGNASSSPAVTLAVRSSRQQILVVGSQPATRRWLNQVLAGAGYDVFTAGDGRAAFELAKVHDVDLVISDLAMSVETMGAIRKSHPLLKIVALARTPGPATLRAADLLGAQVVLTAPLAERALLQRIRVLLQRRPAVY